MSKRSIYIFQHYSTPNLIPGRSRHFYFAKELKKKGVQVYIFASAFHHTLHKNIFNIKQNYYQVQQYEGINYVWIKTFPYKKNNWRRFLNMIEYSYKAICASLEISLKDKPDLVIGSVAHSFALLAAYIVSKILNCNYIVDIGDLWPDVLVETGSLKKNSLLYYILKIISYFCYRRASKIFVLNKDAKKNLVNKGFSQEKIIILPPLRDIGLIKKYKKPLVIGEKRFFNVMYTGSINNLYPVEILVYVAKFLEDKGYANIKFIVVGDGPNKSKVLSLLNKLNVKNFEIYNMVSPRDLYKYFMNKAHLFVLIEKKAIFGYPNKLVDYALWERPILLVTENFYEIAKIKGCFWIKNFKPEEIAKLIIFIYSQSYLDLLKMGKNVGEYATKTFNIEKIIDKLFD